MNDSELHQYTVDSSISDLNVVEGTPLRNEFVVLVSCRNVESRIIRCLHSIEWKSLLFSMFPTYEEAYSYIEKRRRSISITSTT